MYVGVTGASGFVGQALIQTLQQSMFTPIALTRSYTGPGNIAHRLIPNFADTHKLTRALQGCECVVHLIARNHILSERSSGAEDAYIETNVGISMSTLKAAAAAGVRRFIYLSSIKVNGEYTKGQAFSKHSKPAPKDAYGRSKYQAELALSATATELGIELVIIRPPLVYGQKTKGNLASLASAVEKRVPLPLASITNKRDLIALPVLCDLILCCIRHPKAAGEIFLASDGIPRSTPGIIQLIAGKQQPHLFSFPVRILQLLAAVLGKSSQVQRLTGDLEIDISHTCTTLGWQPMPKAKDLK